MKKRFLGVFIVLVLLLTPAAALAGYEKVGVTELVGEIPISVDLAVEWMYEMEDKSNGTMDVFTLREKYGESAVSEAGRDLHVVKMGNGSKVIWIHAQIHGNEKLTTHGLMDFMWDYAHSRTVRNKYKNLTIYAIPIYNPDGSILGQRGTQILDDEGNVMEGFENFDLNRDWKLNMRGEGMGFQAAESRAFYTLFCDIKPDYAVDLHHQRNKKAYGSEVDSITGSMGISLAVDGPTLPYILDGKYNTEGKQIQKYVYDAVIDEIEAFSDIPDIGTTFGIDLYGTGRDIDIYGGVVSGMMTGLDYEGQNPEHHSCLAVFFEMESQSDGTEPYSLRWQKLAEQAYLVSYAYMDAFSTGDFLKVDPDTYWDIPHYPVESFSPDYKEELPAVDWSYLDPDAPAEASDTTDDVLIEAHIVRLRPSKNTLVITVDTGDVRLKRTFEISNKASDATYQVGGYAVRICTEGMDVISCNVSAERLAA